MSVVPRVRQRRVDARPLFAGTGFLAAAGAWGVFFFAYDLGSAALLIAAMVGFGIFLFCEAVFTVIAFVRGWPHDGVFRIREAIAGLLLAVFR